MITPVNTFLVRADPDEKSRIRLGDATMQLDTGWGNGALEYATQTGTVEGAPPRVNSEHGHALIPSVGETIYYDYNVTSRNRVFEAPDEPALYRADYSAIYAIIRNGGKEIIPLHDYIFCEAIDQNRDAGSGLVVPGHEDERNLARIRYVSAYAAEKGLKPGDIVYRGGCNYYNDVMGQRLILIRHKYVEFVKVLENNNFAPTT